MSETLPMVVEYVEWSDAVLVPQGEFTEAEMTGPRVTSMSSAVGFMVLNNEEELVLAMITKGGNSVSNIIVIPKSAIVMRTTLQLVSDSDIKVPKRSKFEKAPPDTSQTL